MVARALNKNTAARRKTKPLTSYDDVPRDVKRIADEVMGKNALESLWNTIIDDAPSGRPSFNLLIRVANGHPVGFALFHYEMVNTKNFQYVIGIIDAVCVRPEYAGKGYGAILTFNVLRRMSLHGVNRIEIILKAPAHDDMSAVAADDDARGAADDSNPLADDAAGDSTSTELSMTEPYSGSERFLYDLGFRKIAYLEEHWYYQSMDYPYTCIVCDTRPDTCKGILMAINEY